MRTLVNFDSSIFGIMGALLLAVFSNLAAGANVSKKDRCYSCASENMKENFLTRERGPRNRRTEPKLYDNLCDLDSWMIREKSAEECEGPCFKWQQILNNSGVLSYSTIRGCHAKMFGPEVDPFASFDGTAGGDTRQISRVNNAVSDCHMTTTQLTCIDQSQLEEHLCYCQGNYCNAAGVVAMAGVTAMVGTLATAFALSSPLIFNRL